MTSPPSRSWTSAAAKACRQETTDPLGVDYRVGDARTLLAFPDGHFAGVTANLCLDDIDELDMATSTVARVLQPGGWFAFSVPHPCFETPHASWSTTPQDRPGRLVSGYYDPAFWRSAHPQGVRRVGNYHRPVSTYLNTLIQQGFAVIGITETRPPQTVTALHPGYVEVPLLLFVRAARLRPQARPATT